MLYFIIFPETVGSLCDEEELQKNKLLKYAFYGAGLYLIVCGLVVDLWMGLGGLSGIILICLSIRLGRVILFMEYISKFVLLIMAVVFHIYGNLRDE